MYVGAEMYREIADREEAKRVFAMTVDRVEMETHSYCNRRCSYCPNVVGDRLGANEHMPDDIWEMIIGGLEEIDYAGSLVLNYYNEPLADRAILGRIREARRRLPKTRIMIYSNGDYLDPEFVRELGETGLNYLHISIHLKRGDRYSDLYVLNRIIEVAVRVGIPARIETVKTREFAIARIPHPTMEIEVRGINFYANGTDRGGLIEDIATKAGRKESCYFPFAHFVVAYNGLIAPCCHIRSDRPEHAPFIYGNLRDHGSIFQAFTSRQGAAWRQELGAGGVEKRSPCDTCAAGVLVEPASQAAFEAAHERHFGAAARAKAQDKLELARLAAAARDEAVSG